MSTLQNLKPDNMTKQTFLDQLTSNWFLWPFYQQSFWLTVCRFMLLTGQRCIIVAINIQVRVMDMYLVEGPKVLYRLALSGLKLFASLSQKLGNNSDVN